MVSRLKHTCSLCANFDSNQSKCTIFKKETDYSNHEEAAQCKLNGYFVRDINVQYSYFNYKNEEGSLSAELFDDLSKLPKDNDGVPLFVLTKRGIERALPAYAGLQLKSHHLTGVKREYTYQGQRELIYEVGVELASKVCDGLGVNLIVLDDERDSKGIDKFKAPYLVYGR